MIKKIVKNFIKALLFIIIFMFIGGFAGILSNRFVMPWLSSIDYFSKFKFFQKANQEVTVINKTEKVTVKEDYSVNSVTENVLPSVVSIITFPEKNNSVDKGMTSIKSSEDINKSVKTGFVITSDGLIVSVWDDFIKNQKGEDLNNDMKYKVLTANGKEFDAKVEAIDNYLQLVFYRIEVENFPVPPFGNSGETETGEKIVICGNASGNYQNFFSLGAIQEKNWTFSLLNSELSFSDSMEGAFISEASISHSNIGGPVVDYSGKVIGIANQIIKDEKSNGYIIPMGKVEKSISRIIATGKIERPKFGAYYLSINKEISLLNNLSFNKGALIYSFTGQQGLAVIKNSPADQAGIKIGDIILKINNKEIDLEDPLSELIAEKKPGEEINLSIYREGKTFDIKTILK